MLSLERTSSNDSTTKTIDEIRIRNCGSEDEIVVKKRWQSISRSFLPQAHLQARRANAHLHVQRKPVPDLGRVGFLKHHKNRLEHVLLRNPEHTVELFTLPPAKVRPLAVLSVFALRVRAETSCIVWARAAAPGNIVVVDNVIERDALERLQVHRVAQLHSLSFVSRTAPPRLGSVRLRAPLLGRKRICLCSIVHRAAFTDCCE